MSDATIEDLGVALSCPVGDWEASENDKLVSQQLAGLIGHIEQAHCTGVPDAVRDRIRACRKELEELPV